MKTSIIILTCNQMSMALACLNSIKRWTPEPYEIMIVDNGSTDATVPTLRLQPEIKLIRNATNAGFAKGCNQGLAIATGDQVLFLNNDTVVAKNWLRNLLRVLYQGPMVGMVGPVTNYASGPQQIPVSYTALTELDDFASQHERSKANVVTEARRLVGFCLLTKRSILYEIGGFDERYELGNFEDDDLCMRAQAGYKLYIAEDAFIHHIGHGTTKQLPGTSLAQVLQGNRLRAKEKWGTDLIELLYKPQIKVSFCILVRKLDERFANCLDSVQGLADEIVLVNARFKTGSQATVSPRFDKWLVKDGLRDDRSLWEHAFDHATMEYIFWMDSDESLSIYDQRAFHGLKHSLAATVDAVAVDDRSLSPEEGVHTIPTRNRLIRRASPYVWKDSGEDLVIEGTVLHSAIAVEKRQD